MKQQAKTIIDGFEANASIKDTVRQRWLVFEHYLEQRELLPGLIEDAPPSTFKNFVQHCEDTGMPDAELHHVLAVIRVVLIRAGYKPDTLTGLTAPRVRRRMKNKNGSYYFELVRPSEPSGPKSPDVDGR